jgi:hypothetical protein
MAKKTTRRAESMLSQGTPSDSTTTTTTSQGSLEDFAEDLGRLLGQAQNKADNWLGQRKAIADHLVGVRDTANRLLSQLGIGDAPARGRQPRSEAGEIQPAPLSKMQRRKRRTMSTEAREKIAAAQRARWAKWKKANSK